MLPLSPIVSQELQIIHEAARTSVTKYFNASPWGFHDVRRIILDSSMTPNAVADIAHQNATWLTPAMILEDMPKFPPPNVPLKYITSVFVAYDSTKALPLPPVAEGYASPEDAFMTKNTAILQAMSNIIRSELNLILPSVNSVQACVAEFYDPSVPYPIQWGVKPNTHYLVHFLTWSSHLHNTNLMCKRAMVDSENLGAAVSRKRKRLSIPEVFSELTAAAFAVGRSFVSALTSEDADSDTKRTAIHKVNPDHLDDESEAPVAIYTSTDVAMSE